MRVQAVTKKEAQERLSDALLRRIFGPATRCDCENCLYEKECEQDNPDFDANYCKAS